MTRLPVSPSVLFATFLLSSAFAAAAPAQTASFIARRDFPAGTSPRSLAAGDFNGDGVPDLAVANGLSNNVSVLLGNGDGTFLAPQNLAAGGFPTSIAVGDFN